MRGEPETAEGGEEEAAGPSRAGGERSAEEARRALTVRVALLPHAVHAAVGVDAQEEASVFAVQPLGILEVAGREVTAAAAVLRQGGQSGDAPGGHGPAGLAPGHPRRRGSRARCRRAPAPTPASEPLGGASPAPAPQPPARRRQPAGPQPRAARPASLRAGAGGPQLGSGDWVSAAAAPDGAASERQLLGSGCYSGHRIRRSGPPHAAASQLPLRRPRPHRPAPDAPPSPRAAPRALVVSGAASGSAPRP